MPRYMARRHAARRIMRRMTDEDESSSAFTASCRPTAPSITFLSRCSAPRIAPPSVAVSASCARAQGNATRLCESCAARKNAGEHAHLSLRLRQERHGRRLHGSRGPGVAWTGVLTWCVLTNPARTYPCTSTLGAPLCVCHRVLQYKCSLGRRAIHGTIKAPSKREEFRFRESDFERRRERPSQVFVARRVEMRA